MKFLGLIPARGGSKRVPQKNMADLGGRPLIAWTIEAALRSRCFDSVVVSTDSADIAAAAFSQGCRVIARPAYLSSDDATSLSVVTHALDRIGGSDAVVLLQPTSPFRSAADIRDATATFERYVNDSLVGVNMGGIVNGAMYITRTKALLRGAPLYDDKSIRFYMSQESSFDIDTPEDLAHARGLIVAGTSR